MSIEDRLKDELARESDRDVDVERLYASTRQRIDAGDVRTRIRPIALVAASSVAVLGIAGSGFMLSSWQDDDPDDSAGPITTITPPEEGRVDKTFTCVNTTTDGARSWDPIRVSRPDLGSKGIERYTFDRHGDTGVMRVGLSDGTLTAKIHLRKQRMWQVERIRHCTGPKGADVAVDGRFELGEHGRPFPEPPESQADDEAPPGSPDSSVQPIDDRAFYNEVGVVDRRTVFANEVDGELYTQATDGELGFYSYGGSNRVPADRLWPLAGFLYDVPGGSDPRDRDFLFVGYYSTRTVTLTATLGNGDTVDADVVRGDDWDGTLYALLAPHDKVVEIVVEVGGETTRYTPDWNPTMTPE